MSNQKIQLYSLATPNGQKVSIALEEMGLDYDAHTINILKGDQFKPEYIQINPNSKIPALIDPHGPNNQPISIMESGAILFYLAEKTGQFLPQDAYQRSNVMQWLFFQMAGIGPMFGQFGHFFKYAVEKCDHPYPLQRYSDESKRLLKVLDTQLSEHEYIAGNTLSIADFSIVPWVMGLETFYHAQEYLSLNGYTHVQRWVVHLKQRPLLQKGLTVCSISKS